MHRSAFFSKPAGQPASGAASGAPVVNESIIAQVPAVSILSNQIPNRSFRFPSSRKFLWDRTPLGRVEVVELKDNLPVFSIPSDFHRCIGPDGMALVSVACPSSSRLLVSLQGVSTSPSILPQGSMVVPVKSSAGTTSHEQLAALLQNLQHGLDRRGAAHLATGLALTLALQPCGPGEAATRATSGAPSTLSVTLLLPAVALTLAPLYTKRLCDVPLAQTLSQPQRPDAGVQTGYLTMDQARSLLPLAADDTNVYSVPLVGVWVRGARGLDHPLLFNAALQFAYATALPDRAVQPDGAFLLLLFTGESPVPRCYEARFADPAAQQPLRPHAQDGCSALLSPAAGGSGPDDATGGPGLRVLPYVVRAELVGQTSAPLELKPVLDSAAAAAAGPRLTLPPSSTSSNDAAPSQATQHYRPPHHAAAATPAEAATTPRGGLSSGFGGLGARLASAMASVAAPTAAGSVNKYDAHGLYGMYNQLRGSGSKLMTSPSKAMKILAGEGGRGGGFGGSASGGTAAMAFGRSVSGYAAWVGSGAGAAAAGAAAGMTAAGVPLPTGSSTTGWGGSGAMYGTGGAAPPALWAPSSSSSGPGPGFFPGAGTQRDSPPVPRSSAVPTPFRTAPAQPSGAAVSAARGANTPSAFGGGVGTAATPAVAPPRDPRLLHRAGAAEQLEDRAPAAAAGPRSSGERTAWASYSRGPVPPASSSAAGAGDLPMLPAVRVTAAAATAAAVTAAPSRAGSAEWSDPANGVMGTPAAALLTRHDSHCPEEPTLHDPAAGPYAHLQQQACAVGAEAMQQPPQTQQQQQSQTQQPGVWGAGGAATPWVVPGSARQGQGCPSGAAVVGTGEHHGFPGAVGYGRGQVGEAPLDQPAPAHMNYVPVSNAYGGVNGCDGGTWRAAGSAGGAAAASQSLDGWLRAGGGRVGPDECGSPEPGAEAGLACGRGFHFTSQGGDCAAQDAAAAYRNDAARSYAAAAAAAAQQQPHQLRPASAGSRHPHLPLQQHHPPQHQPYSSTCQAQQPWPGEPGGKRSQPAGPPARPLCNQSDGPPVGQGDAELLAPPPGHPHHPQSSSNGDQQQRQDCSQRQRPHLQHAQLHQQQSLARQIVFSDDSEAGEVASEGLELADLGDDELPLDPLLLKQEVIRLRRQLADLQHHLRGLTGGAQPLALDNGQELSRAPTQEAAAEPPAVTCRLAAAAVTATPAAGAAPRPAAGQVDAQDHPGRDTTSAAVGEGMPHGRPWQHWQGQQQQQQAVRRDGAPAGCSGNSNNADPTTAAAPGAEPGCTAGAEAAGSRWQPQQRQQRAAENVAGNAATAAAAADAVADRVKRMSVVSEASDRGSVWSMASLRSSVISYQSCRSMGTTSRLSAGEGASGSGDASGGSGCAGSGSGSIQPGAAVGLPMDSGSNQDWMSDQESRDPNGVGDGRHGCSGDAAGSSSGRELPSPHQVLARGAPPSRPGSHEPGPGSRPGTATDFRAAAAPSATPAAGQFGAASRTGLASQQPSPALPSAARGRPYASGCYGVGVASRGRRRARRSGTDSDSDDSLPSGPEDGVTAARPSISQPAAEGPPASRPQVPAWRAYLPSAGVANADARARDGDTGGTESAGGWPGPAQGHGRPPAAPAAAAVTSPRSSGGGSSSRLSAAVATAAVVRTKYIPLDDDSDSSDAESDLLMMQKYGITAM